MAQQSDGKRARLNLPPEEFSKAIELTGKTSPVDVFRELLRLAEQAKEQPPVVEERHIVQHDPPGYNRNPTLYNFTEKLNTERKYWQARRERTMALAAELHLAKEVGKMDKEELEIIVEAPKRLPELTTDICYKCSKPGHWAYQCPNVSW